MAALLVAGMGEASANAALCRQLESQLAAASKPAGPSGTQIRRYDKAIVDQKRQVQNVRAQLGDMGCGFFSFRDECSGARATLRRMEENLSDLERKRAGMGRHNAGRDQGRILAALRDNDCRAGGRTVQRNREAANREPTLMEHLFGRNEDPYAPDGDSVSERREAASRRPAGGSFRTLCVRTCDGDFFPISYSSTRADFDRDAKACAAMCPGTETALYHHRVPGQESEEMVSAASGAPYADLPAAFSYRKAGYTRPAQCSCGTPQDFSIIAGAFPGRGEEPVEVIPPSPVSRPDSAEDPETAANRAGGLDAAALQGLFAEPEPMPVASIRRDDDGQREVRVVGPAFLPDPGEAIDLRAPARRDVR